MITCICETCDRMFKKSLPRYKRTKHDYCSLKCSGKSKRIDGALWRNPEHIKLYMREYTKRNREKLNKQQRELNQRKPDNYHARQKRWRLNNPIKLRLTNYRRYRTLVGGSVSEVDWNDIKERYNHRCANCQKQEPDIKLELDHIVPLSKSGCHEATNIQPLCRSCNGSKGNKEVLYRLC